MFVLLCILMIFLCLEEILEMILTCKITLISFCFWNKPYYLIVKIDMRCQRRHKAAKMAGASFPEQRTCDNIVL